MKYKLPILPAVFLLASGHLAATAQPPASPAPPPQPAPVATPAAAANPASANNDAPAEAADGQQLVAAAVQQLDQIPALEARVRQRVDLFGQQFVGSGLYLQAGSGTERLVRLELKLQVGSKVSSVQQVCDGQFLWTRHDLPRRSTLARIDLRRVRQAIEDRGGDAALPPVDPQRASLAAGGLPTVMSALQANFRFGAARAETLQTPGGRLGVWVVEGRWKVERLAQVVGGEQAGPQPLDELPPQLPHRVLLVLARDANLPLLPYRIEYQRRDPEQPAVGFRPLVVFELFEVQQPRTLDPRQFRYNPGDQEVLDHTDAYLDSQGLGQNDRQTPGR